ncbi:hypothetical protein KA005_79670, partial [bacterium]|nr:hypothetical protein [bacterium]
MVTKVSPVRRRWLNGLQTMLTVLNALGHREIKTRFGQYRFGYIWALAEPTAHVIVLSVIFGIRSPTTTHEI